MAQQENHPVSLADVARKAGVSTAAVSMALSGTGTISRKTRDLVRQIAEQIGYRPNLAASLLARQKQEGVFSGVPIAVIGMGFKKPYAFPSVSFMQHFIKHATQRGFAVEEVDTDDFPSFSKMLRVLYHRGVRGIVLNHSIDTSKLTEKDVEPFSVLIHGQPLLGGQFHRVSQEAFKSARFLWETMWNRGYHRIGCALHWHPQDVEDDFAREAAVISCQIRHKAPPLPIFTGGLYNNEGLTRWFQETKPDAVLAFSGGQYYQLKAAGYRIPEDVGFAILNASLSDEIISGLYADDDELGRLTVIHLDSMIRHNETGFPAQSHELLVPYLFKEGKTLPFRSPTDVQLPSKLKKPSKSKRAS